MAYPLRVHLETTFRHLPLAPPMQEYNESMSSVRIAVEWLFGDITNSFKYLDFKKNLKIGLSSVGKMYIVSALLRNAITCLYGNETSVYFGIEPPTLEEYFQWNRPPFFRKWNDTPFSFPVPTPLSYMKFWIYQWRSFHTLHCTLHLMLDLNVNS